MKTVNTKVSSSLKKLDSKRYSVCELAKLSAKLVRQATNISKLFKLMENRTVNLKYLKLNLKRHEILSEQYQRASLELLNQAQFLHGLSSQEALAVVMHMNRTLAKLKTI